MLVIYKTDCGSFQILRSRRFCLIFSLKINVASQYSGGVRNFVMGGLATARHVLEVCCRNEVFTLAGSFCSN